MLTPFRPAVFACPMRYMHGKKTKRVWPPPYPAWPEIADPSTYYTLPTLYSYPAINSTMYWPWDSYRNDDDDGGEKLSLCELFRLHLPDLAEEKIQELTEKAEKGISIVNIFTAYESRKLLRSWCRRLVQIATVEGRDDPMWSAFARVHELGHDVSLSTERPTTIRLYSLASATFDLLRPDRVAQYANFWDVFQDHNGALVEYLDKTLILEELRATLFAFAYLGPDVRYSIEPDLRKHMAEEGTISLFDALANATDKDWLAAYHLSLLAECTPAHPIEGLHFLCRAEGGTLEMLWKEIYTKDQPSPHKVEWSINFRGSMNGRIKIDCIPHAQDGVDAIDHWSWIDLGKMLFLESLIPIHLSDAIK
jgi:hypothetical protein